MVKDDVHVHVLVHTYYLLAQNPTQALLLKLCSYETLRETHKKQIWKLWLYWQTNLKVKIQSKINQIQTEQSNNRNNFGFCPLANFSMVVTEFKGQLIHSSAL